MSSSRRTDDACGTPHSRTPAMPPNGSSPVQGAACFDASEARPFLDVLLGRSAAMLGVRDLRAVSGDRAAHSLLTASCDRAIHFAESATATQRNVYVSVLTRTVARTTVSVGAYDALWADLDCGKGEIASGYDTKADALDALEGFDVSPTLLVDSGTGIHAWWLLSSAVTKTELTTLVHRLNCHLRGDPAATDVTRLLRVPGTTNFKRTPLPVRLLNVGSFCSVAAIDRALPPVPTVLAEPVMLPAPTLSRSASRGTGSPFDQANDVAVAAILPKLGVDTLHRRGTRLYCACPVCPGVDTREMVVGGARNVATCFGDCHGRTYTSVDLVAAVRGVSPRASVDWISDTFGLVGFPRTADR